MSESMSSAEIRQSFLDFFAERGHTIVPSASLVPADDPSLLFTNAGMNQFKDVFLGAGTRTYSRAADAQKIMRVSGKHNDLEEVGRDVTHHTFFEMLGNWSFGDYYKREAIRWAWELLTEVWGLPGDRLWASVFRDDEGDLGADEEAAGFWRSETGIDPEHIVFFGRAENFWEMADTGPCGPDSEIHFDRGPDACDRQDDPDHVCRVNGDCERFVEIWNLVFIQYDRDAQGVLHPLPARHVDTGMGFERLVSIMQGVPSNYQTDLFWPIIDGVRQMLVASEEDVQANIVPYRVIADHSRAITFLIGDGVLPGNEGRNYVLRMILRRAARFGRDLGFSQPFLADVARIVIDIMGPHYPELQSRREFILTTITQEEERFLRTLEGGLTRLDELMADLRQRGTDVVPGEEAFRLYDTFGLPLEITRDVAEERGFTIDEAGYRRALDEQRRRAREADGFSAVDEEAAKRYLDVLTSLQADDKLADRGVDCQPYDEVELQTEVVALLQGGERVKTVQPGDEIEVVLPETPFYVQSGGQVSDVGYIAAFDGEGEQVEWQIDVDDVRQPIPGFLVHVGTVIEGQPRVGDGCWAVVDYRHRMDVARNHTATHLLHSELRYLLGEHVQQAGSLVSSDRLRFDFTHPAMLTQDEIDAVERSVNDAILANYPVSVAEEDYQDAIREGVIALFGEKYGDQVRVVRVGWPDDAFSQELCGGTHVETSGDIGLFHIVSEESVGAGVRRIEAVTGRGAVELVSEQLGMVQRTAAYLGVPSDQVDRKVLALLDDLQAARKQISRLEEKLARREFEGLLDQVQQVGDVPLLSARVTAQSMDVLREMTDWFRDRLGSAVIVLGTVLSGRPALVAAVTQDLVDRGIDAGALVRDMAATVGGGGGGRPTLAQAGGRDAERLNDALGRAAGLVEEMLASA